MNRFRYTILPSKHPNAWRSRKDLSAGSYKAVVASSSLELGVDFQAVDQVLLIGTPRGVSRALQRLGRSGHRIDGIASGYLLPTSVPDVMQSIALRKAAHEGNLDRLRIPDGPLDVLAQGLLGMSIEKPWRADGRIRNRPQSWSVRDALD